MIVTDYDLAFCNILAVAINKSNFDEVKKLLEQKRACTILKTIKRLLIF